MDFSSAGILFQNLHQGTFLSGFNSKLNCWSGFGGGKMGNETPWETAVREVVEEIFGIYLPPTSLQTLQQAISPLEFFKTGDYICFVLSIDYLFKISEMIDMLEYKSPFYGDVFPKTISDLLEKRTIESHKYFEIRELAFLKPKFHGPIDFHFLNDMTTVLKS